MDCVRVTKQRVRREPEGLNPCSENQKIAGRVVVHSLLIRQIVVLATWIGQLAIVRQEIARLGEKIEILVGHWKETPPKTKTDQHQNEEND